MAGRNCRRIDATIDIHLPERRLVPGAPDGKIARLPERSQVETRRGNSFMKKSTTGLLFTAAAFAAIAAGPANAVSKKVEKLCEADYNRFCIQYTPGSTEVRRCFESNRKQLSRKCINALVDAGEVPKKYLKR